MWVKTVQKGLVMVDCIIKGKGFVDNEGFLEYIGIVTELPKKQIAIYHQYENQKELQIPNKQMALSQRFLAVVVEGEYSPANDMRATYYMGKYKELEEKGLIWLNLKN